jgi:DNA-binding transcriptional ArsR family regulator
MASSTPTPTTHGLARPFDQGIMKKYFRKMSFINGARITDARVMRALAHPVRTALLSRLHISPATATECAEVVGESPSACSYHLRKLADLGFVEEIPSADGRERRWKIVVSGYWYEGGDAAEERIAYNLLAAENLRVAGERIAAYIAAEASLPKEWTDAALVSTGAVYATAEELANITRELRAAIDSYLDRVDPARRPPDARRVAFHMYAVPWWE